MDERRWVRQVQLETRGTLRTIETEAVVNCAGPASHAVNLAFNCPLGISTAPQRQFIVEATWSNPKEGVPAMADLAEGFYIRPHRDVFKIGAAMAMDHVDFDIDTVSEQTLTAKDAFEERVFRSLSHRVPGIQLKNVVTKTAFYDWSVSDSYPIIDDTDVGGYFVAIGTSGAWFKSGPAFGDMMAEKIDRNMSGNKNNDFKLAQTGNVIRLDDFSVRKRLTR